MLQRKLKNGICIRSVVAFETAVGSLPLINCSGGIRVSPGLMWLFVLTFFCSLKMINC